MSDITDLIREKILNELDKIGEQQGIPLKREAHNIIIEDTKPRISIRHRSDMPTALAAIVNEWVYSEIERKLGTLDKKASFRFNDADGTWEASNWSDLIEALNSALSDENRIDPSILGRRR